VAKEEGLDMALQKKLNDKAVAHPNLFVSSILPASIASYDFIFLDSVNKLGLQPEDLTGLKRENPTKSFVFFPINQRWELQGSQFFSTRRRCSDRSASKRKSNTVREV
jgi:hypothetical protein